VKSFVRPSFFRVFDLLLSTSNPGLKRSRWTYEGIDFERERLSLSGPNHGLAVDIVTLTRAGRRGWKLMVTKEFWWVGPDSNPLKNLHWARQIAGQRNDIPAAGHSTGAPVCSHARSGGRARAPECGEFALGAAA
jgi:hypothetical protein